MWGRKIKLEVLEPQTGETLFYLDDHRIDFLYEGTGGGHIADVCTISLFNLSLDLIKMFADSGTDPYTQVRNYVRVRLTTWYQDGLQKTTNSDGVDTIVGQSQIIDGFVMNVFGRRELPDHILTLYVIPLQALAFNTVPLNFVVEEPTNFVGMIRKLVESFSTGGEKYQVLFDFSEEELDKINSYVFRNISWEGAQAELLAKICDSVNATFNLQGYQLTITTFKTADQLSLDVSRKESQAGFLGTMHKIYPVNLRGLPQIGMSKFECTYTLSPEMKSFDTIDVSSILRGDGESEVNAVGTLHNGRLSFYSDDAELWAIHPYYMIKTFSHAGSNYSSTWETKISAVVFRDSLSLLQRGMLVDNSLDGNIRTTS